MLPCRKERLDHVKALRWRQRGLPEAIRQNLSPLEIQVRFALHNRDITQAVQYFSLPRQKSRHGQFAIEKCWMFAVVQALRPAADEVLPCGHWCGARSHPGKITCQHPLLLGTYAVYIVVVLNGIIPCRERLLPCQARLARCTASFKTMARLLSALAQTTSSVVQLICCHAEKLSPSSAKAFW